MNTIWMLAGRYEGRPMIPVEIVCRDFFTHLTPEKFLRKVADGSLPLPIVKMEHSQKSAKAVHVEDLAVYLDERRRVAQSEHSLLYA